MTWVAWRQQRTETVVALAIIALLAVILVPTGLNMASAYRHDGVAACLSQTTSDQCGQVVQSFVAQFQKVTDLSNWFTLLPGLVGVLLAAPFVMQLENRTFRLDWTQGISRTRWIAGKLGVAIAAALVFAVLYVALLTWWRAPLVRIDGRMENGTFDSEGLVVLGYTLFALGLGLALGAVWRRAVVSLVAGFVGYFVMRLFVDTWLRQRLTPPLSALWPFDRPEPAFLNHAWVISENPSTRAGVAVTKQFVPCGNPPHPCLAHGAPPFMHALYEPAGRFWTMQAVEFAFFAVLAAGLIAFAAWWTSARTT